jgi:cytoskeletal protein CcmA (bactofilin family)
MARLLSGSTLRRGGSREFLDLKGAMPQLPPSETTATGFTVATDSLYRTTYRSSLGFIEIHTATMWSALPEGTIRILSSGTSFLAENTYSGNLVVEGGVGIGGNMHVEEDIVINGLTLGKGYEGRNNLVFRGSSVPQINDFNEGQSSISIGYDSLQGIITSYKNIAIGRYTLSSGTELSNSIAIGDSALKEIGSVKTIYVATVTGITLVPSMSITAATNSDPVLVTAAGHGLSTGTQVYITGVVGLTTGSSSLVNNKPFWIDVVNSNSFELYVNKTLSKGLNGTSATIYTSSGTIISPVIVESINHNLTTGTNVFIDNIVGTTELNNKFYYVDSLTSSTLAIFVDSILNKPLDGTGFTSYISDGTLSVRSTYKNNVALGVDAGKKLINGSQNLLLGDRVGLNLTTGSNNILIGYQTSLVLKNGSGNISLGGDNIVDGLDNQVNIGSVFYFDGQGNANLSADTTIGLGSLAEILTPGPLTATSQVSAGTAVIGGLFVWKNAVVAENIDVLGVTTSTIAGRLDINDETEANTYLSGGALHIEGGLSVNKSIHVGQNLVVIGNGDVTLSPDGGDVFLKPALAGTVEIYPNTQGLIDNVIIGSLNPAAGTFDQITGDTLQINSTASSISTTTGQAVVVNGGIGILKDAYVAGGIYGRDGNTDEGNLIYSPKVTVTSSTVAPLSPKVGDIWIDASIPAYLQYIKDGTSTFWIQVGAV